MLRLIEAVPESDAPRPAGAAASDELSALRSLGGELTRSFEAEPGSENDPAFASFFAAGERILLVRSVAGDPSFACPVLLGPAPSAVCLDVATIAAEACFGMSASRFTAAVPPTATPEAIDAVLAGLAASSDAGPLPPAGVDRARWALRRMFQRTKAKRAVLNELPLEGPYGTAVSRDPRTGKRPALAKAAASLRGLLEAPGRSAAPLAELAQLPESERARLDDIMVSLETASERPVRLAFVVEAGRARIVSVEPLRRAGIVAFELARDLLKRKVLAPREALALIEPSDVMQAIEPRLVVDAGAGITTGVAAGSGLAEGFVALTPGQAEELHRAGLPSVLVVHEVMPEDIGALRASAGIVTVRGGITGEAAVMARGLAKPCVASGSALSLGSGEVQNASGSAIRPYERITIDGGTGAIVRGAAARHLSEVPPAVTALLDVVAADGGTTVLASVDHPNHVLTAKRFGANGVLLVGPERVAFELLSQPSSETFEARLRERLRAIAEAARSSELPLAIAMPRRGISLPRPVGRPLSTEELDAFARALEEVRARGEIEIVVGEATLPPPADARVLGVFAGPGGSLPVGALPAPPRTVYLTAAEAAEAAPGFADARIVMVTPRPDGADLAKLSRLAAGAPGRPRALVGFACDPAAVLPTRLLLGQIDR